MLPIIYRVPGWVPLLGGEPITSFGLLLLLGVLAGGAWLARSLDHDGVPRTAAWDLVVLAAVGGLVGAKLLFLAFHPRAFEAGVAQALLARTGLNGIGALLGAAAVGAWRARRLGVARLVVADAAAPALALVYGIGRIGSFLAGVDYGRPTTTWLGVAFRRGAPPTTPANLVEHFGVLPPVGAMVGDHVAVHPTQLYEAAVAFLLFVVLTRWRWGPGTAAGLFLVVAGCARFAVDFLRLGMSRAVGPLTLDQVAALFLVLAGALLIRRGRKGTEKV